VPRRAAGRHRVAMVALISTAVAGLAMSGCGAATGLGQGSTHNRPDALAADRSAAAGAAAWRTGSAALGPAVYATGKGIPPRPQPVKGPILEVGDSLGIDLGWGLQAELAGSGHPFLGEAVGDTGLAEPSYYDWPAHLASYLAEYHPGLVVVFLGANDVENLYAGGRFDPFGGKGWRQAYGSRVASMMDEATAAGAKVLWVGMPPMAQPDFSADMATLNALYRAQATRHTPAVKFFSSWTVLGDAHGQYEQGPPGAAGEENPWRTADGVHMTTQGADHLARAIVAYLKEEGWLAGARPSAHGREVARRQAAHPVAGA